MSGLTDRLDDTHITVLRQGYDEAMLRRAAVETVGGFFAPGGTWLDFVRDEIYGTDRMKPVDRERCLITLLASRPSPLTLGVHVYWGIAAGLSLDEIGQAIMLSGTYTGIDNYSRSMIIARDAADALRALIDRGEGPFTSAVVLEALVARFA